MGYGIDYGNGETNVDHATGIRYGVIPQNDVLQSWSDSSESDYGAPHCPKCGNEALSIDDENVPDIDSATDWEDNGRDHACVSCRYSFNADEAYGDDPLAFTLDDGEYVATQGGDDTDIFVIKSPYFTYAQFCSPCAPGACHLRQPVDENGPRAYCFAPDWFDCHYDDDALGVYNGANTACPYPVYRVSDGACIYRPFGDENTPNKPR